MLPPNRGLECLRIDMTSGAAFARYPYPLLLVLFGLLAMGSLFTGLLFGSVHIPVSGVVQALLSSSESISHQIIWQLRLPRVLAAFACGGLLALAGALLQVLLRNPLADPYILGVSGGAAVGALLAMLLGWGTLLTNLTSLAGALTAVAIVFGLSFRAGNWNLYRLLLDRKSTRLNSSHGYISYAVF